MGIANLEALENIPATVQPETDWELKHKLFRESVVCFLIVLLEDYIAAGNVIKAVGQAESLFNQRGPFHAEDKAIRDLAETILERVEAIPETRSENAESN